MAAIALLMCLFIPFLGVICMNFASIDILFILCINNVSFYSTLMNWVPYFFPKNFILSRPTLFPAFPPLGLVVVFSCSLVSISLDSDVSVSLSTGAYLSLVSIWNFSSSSYSMSSFFLSVP